MAISTIVFLKKNQAKKMRKQTLFLFLAALSMIITVVMPLASFEPQVMGIGRILNSCTVVDDGHIVTFMPIALLFMAVVVIALQLWAMIAKKRLMANPKAKVANRKLQSRLCLIAVILIVVWYGIEASVILAIKGGDTVHIEFASVLPALSLILTLMARNSINADERLVRSADRLR